MEKLRLDVLEPLRRKTRFSAFPSPKFRRAFSLIELLVVLVVLVALVALAFPGMQSASRSAKQAKNTGNLRAIGAAALGFAADCNGHLPPHGTLHQKYSTISYEVGQFSTPGFMAPPSWLVSKAIPFGGSDMDRLQPDQFYSPFSLGFEGRGKGRFFQLGKKGQIGYMFYYLPRKSMSTDILSTVYNDTVREDPNTPLYSDFCAFRQGQTTASTCGVLYLGGHVKIFQQNEINGISPRGWGDVINFFRKNH